jgi:hypothetical protein
MGIFDIFKRKKVEIPKSDWTTWMPKEYTDDLLNFIKTNSQACQSDEIQQGFGEYGLEKTNPIPTYGIPSNETYLQSLRTSNGEVLRYRRNGGIEVDNIEKRVDEYEIYNFSGEIIAYLYLSPYHWQTSSKAPIGFYFKGKPKTATQISESPVIIFNQKSAYEEFTKKLKLEEEKRRELQRERESILKPDWEKYKSLLIANNIFSIYHFTDRVNLISIKKYGGLYSWYHCVGNNIEIASPGGNQLSRELDSRKGLQDFVRVSFTRNHPMMYIQPIRSRNNVILEVDTEVIYLKGTKYADKNATRNDVCIGSNLEDFQRYKFKLFKFPNHFELSEIDKPYYQGEILVPTFIPAKYIKNLNDLISNNDFH